MGHYVNTLLFYSLNDPSWITNEDPQHPKRNNIPWYTGRGLTV
jgi:hypothetical protein